MKRLLLFLSLLLVGLSPKLLAQSAYEAYINQYSDMAVEQMRRYGIPASITLAQGLLESGAGRSTLATKANNHFGIKVGGSWTGPYILRDDDAPNERFRAYRSARESYEDHSRFLVNGRRYAGLFRLSRTDYKGWAHGLKAAGYATNPRYAHLLIDLIERYHLQRFDGKHYRKPKGGTEVTNFVAVGEAKVYRLRDNYYIIARPGETYASLARDLRMSLSRLCSYNEVPKDAVLQPGDIVFLEKKEKRADKSLKGHYHTVRPGESIHSISQQYGMRMKTLYRLNHLPDDYVPRAGARLRIR